MNALPQMARPAFAGLRNGVYLMKKLVLIAALGAAAVARAQFAARAAETPCEDSLKALRAAALYGEDDAKAVRKSHENPLLKKVYAEYLGEPGGEKAHHILHTRYTAREKLY